MGTNVLKVDKKLKRILNLPRSVNILPMLASISKKNFEKVEFNIDNNVTIFPNVFLYSRAWDTMQKPLSEIGQSHSNNSYFYGELWLRE